jgi:hypothetical protein
MIDEKERGLRLIMSLRCFLPQLLHAVDFNDE